MRQLLTLAFALPIIFATTSCKKEDDEAKPSYEVPSTYNYTNVSYDEATTLIAMCSELDALTNTGNNSAVVSAAKMQGMFTNTGNYFSTASGLNASSIDIYSFTAPDARVLITAYLDSINVASQSTVPYSNGVAGVSVSSNDATKKYLFNKDGYEYRQVVSKMFQVSLFFYNIKHNYFSAAGIGGSVDNSTIVNGQGTALQHNWDLAFGYFGVPKDFPTNKTGLKYLGGYSDRVNPSTNSNAIIMNAYLKGRAAINNNDNATKNDQANLLNIEIEKMIAASIILEFNKAKGSLTDVTLRNHFISEGVGFIYGLRSLPTSQLDAQMATIISNLPANLENITLNQINTIIDTVSTVYGLDAVKNSLL